MRKGNYTTPGEIEMNETNYKQIEQTHERLHGDSAQPFFNKDDLYSKSIKKNAKPAGMHIDSVPATELSMPGYGGSKFKEMSYKEMIDIEMGHDQRRDFTREDFQVMISNTYNEFYGKFRDQFNPNEYLQCVDQEDLVKLYGHDLEQSNHNILTPHSMPWLDLGTIPFTHSFMRTEAEQIYYVPNNVSPDQIFVRYS